MYLCGDFNGWDRHSCPLTHQGEGVWEVSLKGKSALKHGQKVMAIVVHDGQELDRIPLYSKYVVQIPQSIDWSAEIYAPKKKFQWTDDGFKPMKTPYIYVQWACMTKQPSTCLHLIPTPETET